MSYIVRCTLPNASASINGVEFAPEDGAMVALVEDAAVAESFAAIPGYEVVAKKRTKDKAAADTPEPPKPIAEMSAREIELLLHEHPDAVQQVEEAEQARPAPRKAVLALIAAAREPEQP